MAYDGQALFEGYVTGTSKGIDYQLAVTCSSDLSLLADVHIRISDVINAGGGREPDSAYGMSGREIFANAITAYNQNNPNQSEHFVIGHNIETNDIGRVVTNSRKSVEYNTSSPMPALDVIRRFILEPYGCYLKTWWDESRTTRYIGLYVSTPDESTQVIRFAENMTSFQLDTCEDDFYTGVYPLGGTATDYSRSYNVDTFHLLQPLGATNDGTRGEWMYIDAPWKYNRDYVVLDDEDDMRIAIGDIFVVGGVSFEALSDYYASRVMVMPADHTDEDLTTEPPYSIPSGAPVYYKGHSPRLRDTYTVSLDGISDGVYGDYTKRGPLLYHTSAVSRYGLRTFTYTDGLFFSNQLLESAKARLAPHIEPTVSLTVDAVDMAFYSSGYTHLQVGQRLRIVHELYGIDLYMQLIEMDIDPDNPGSTTHLFGQWQNSVTRAFSQQKSDVASLRNDLAKSKTDIIQSSTIWGLR
jgi:hypothetical protein